MAELDGRERSQQPPEQTPEAEDWGAYERQYYRAATSYDTFGDFKQAILAFRTRLSREQLALVRTWTDIGSRNPWIGKAYDPPFTELSIHICQDIRELADKLLHGNWCLGQSFALENICFINQIDGADEWLTIRGEVPFESITMQTFHETREEAETRLTATIERIRQATDEQLRQLDY